MFMVFYDQEDYPITINTDAIESVEWGSEENDPTQVHLTSGRFYQLDHVSKKNHLFLSFVGGDDWVKFTTEE